MAERTALRALTDRLDPPSVGDGVAGISVALILIPQSLAYAVLAGMPPASGLAVAGVTSLVAAPFVSSPMLQTGPSAVTSLLTLGSLATMATVGGVEYVKLAALLTLLVGLIQIAVGLSQSGELAYLLSEPVLAGFTSAAGIVIAASQLPKVLGVSVGGENIVGQAIVALSRPGAWDLPALAFGAATVGIMLLATRVNPLIPGVLIAVVAGVGMVKLGGYEGALVGDIPSALPVLSLDLPWGQVGPLLAPALVIALVGFSPVAAIARTYASDTPGGWEPDREFSGQGVANVASGLIAGFPVGGSFSRSAVNRQAGADSPWSGAITGLVTLAALPFVGLLKDLPAAVLGGIIIGAVLSLMDPRPVWELRLYSRQQFLIASVTFVLTLVLAPRIQWAVLVGIGLAIGGHLRRERNLSTEHWTDDGQLHLRPVGVLYFASAQRLEAEFRSLITEIEDVHTLIIHFDAVGRTDVTGAYSLRKMFHEAKEEGLAVEVADLTEPSRRVVSRVLTEADRLSMNHAGDGVVEEEPADAGDGSGQDGAAQGDTAQDGAAQDETEEDGSAVSSDP